MKYQIVIYFYLVLNIGVFCKDTRIVGGTDANIREFPYLVSLRHLDQNTLFCGGMIISQKHILSAAHCLFLHQNKYDSIRIYTVATSPTTVTGTTYQIDKAIFHPSFTGQMTPSTMNVNDVSVIKIKETIEFNEFQNKIDLPTQPIEDHVLCTISGWGAINFPEDVLPEQLQKTEMTIVDRNTCVQVIPFTLHSGQICGYHSKGVGSCTGDSGGPLVYNNKLVGIISFSLPCAQGLPDLFTDVYYYLRFIRAAMRV